MPGSILLIEDEAAIADNVVYALQTEGFTVRWTALGLQGLELLRSAPFDLVVLDVGLPDIDGFELCRRIRAFDDTPILFLTARSDEIDRVVGLELGADDYVTKPFSPRELAARVKAILRRHRATPRIERGFGVELERGRASFDGQPLELTLTELRVLALLLSQPERIFSRAQIMDAAWDEPEAAFDRAVDSHIKTLRAKLRPLGADGLIRTHRGQGYSARQPTP